ncbi:MAG TPA: sulfatase [Solirubrobacterales bacterium]|nr:sulfatase [Solirubrobacterales bacterium]
MRSSGRGAKAVSTATVVLAALSVHACGNSGDRSQSRASPNVVVVMTDDQDARSIRFMPYVSRRLAARGTTFQESFATTPMCCPSRATFLTGQYSHNHGVLGNRPPDGGYPALDGSDTLAVWLHDGGYRTGHIGRYLNNYAAPQHGGDPTEVPPGWDEWRVPVEDTEFQMYANTLNENGELKRYGNRPRDYQTDLVARKAVRFARRSSRGERPFFLSVATLAPHDEGILEDIGVPRNPRPAPRHLGRFSDLPLPRPPSFNERAIGDKPGSIRDDPRLRAAEIEALARLYRSRLESLLAVDEMVAELVRALRRSHELRDTLFIFSSDNGYLLGEHRLHGKEAPYEEAVRVPLVIRGPGFPAGVTRSQPVGNVDLAPTILDVAEVRPPHELDGTSLVPVARDPSAGSARTVLLEMLTGNEFTAVRTQRLVYAERKHGAVELYDLRHDPNQLHNVADDRRYSRVRERLAELLRALDDCTGAACRPGAG